MARTYKAQVISLLEERQELKKSIKNLRAKCKQEKALFFEQKKEEIAKNKAIHVDELDAEIGYWQERVKTLETGAANLGAIITKQEFEMQKLNGELGNYAGVIDGLEECNRKAVEISRHLHEAIGVSLEI